MRLRFRLHFFVLCRRARLMTAHKLFTGFWRLSSLAFTERGEIRNGAATPVAAGERKIAADWTAARILKLSIMDETGN